MSYYLVDIIEVNSASELMDVINHLYYNSYMPEFTEEEIADFYEVWYEPSGIYILHDDYPSLGRKKGDWEGWDTMRTINDELGSEGKRQSGAMLFDPEICCIIKAASFLNPITVSKDSLIEFL